MHLILNLAFPLDIRALNCVCRECVLLFCIYGRVDTKVYLTRLQRSEAYGSCFTTRHATLLLNNTVNRNNLKLFYRERYELRFGICKW